MKLNAEQQKKVEDNLGLVNKVINDKVHGPYNLLVRCDPECIPGTTCSRLDALAFAKLQQQTKAATFLHTPTD